MHILWCLIILVILLALAGIGFSFYLAYHVLHQSTGTEEMREISDAIVDAAGGYMSRMYRTIAVLTGILAVVIFGLWCLRPKTGSSYENVYLLAGVNAVAFLFGAVCSAIAGYCAMWVAVRANLRVADACTTSYVKGIQIALRGGGMSGVLIVALSLLGVALSYTIVWFILPAEDHSKIPDYIVGYGFGASFVALMSQVGGGIYTKAADMGADLVGKIEQGWDEDDPYNPATIADLVGDNVGDCAGRGADLFESCSAENIGAMVLAANIIKNVPNPDEWLSIPHGWTAFPLVCRAFGLVCCCMGIMIVRGKDSSENQPLLGEDAQQERDPMSYLNTGAYFSFATSIVAFLIACYWLLRSPMAPNCWWHFGICGCLGVITAFCYLQITEYYCDYIYRPVRSIADASVTGHATNVVTGLAVGMESTALPTLCISVVIIASYWLGRTCGLQAADGSPLGGLFGTGVATMGMLAPAAYVLALDTFGPISDNAGGIVEMSELPAEIRVRTDRLDAVGNTTKALTKGYAVGSAALAAFLLFAALLDQVKDLANVTDEIVIDLADPHIFVAAFIGAGLAFLFSGWTIQSVSKTSQSIIHEVRQQLSDNPGIKLRTSKPNYARCTDITTKSALREMIKPSVLVVATPIGVGLSFRLLGYCLAKTHYGSFDSQLNILGAKCVAATLMVGTISGLLLALMQNNAGGAWDNAKKLVETGTYQGMSKGTDAHLASITGDCVGDPLKDTSGPSLHVLVKTISSIALVLAPVFVNAK